MSEKFTASNGVVVAEDERGLTLSTTDWRKGREAMAELRDPAVQGEPNGDREALARALFIASDDFAFADRMAKAWDAPGPHGRQRWYRYADAVIAAGFSLAAVPDAATEAGRWHLLYEKGVEERVELRAERDAALAAIERIRQAVSGHPECDRHEEGDVISCGWKSAYASVVAALDGAPEPEVKP